jgi:hypothetical protein
MADSIYMSKTIQCDESNNGVGFYLIEFYTTEGDINFAWVNATTHEEAQQKLVAHQGDRLDTVIQCGYHKVISPLGGDFRVNTPDADLFILH